MTDIKDRSGNKPQGIGASAVGPKHGSRPGNGPQGQETDQESVPEWLGSRLRQMFTDVMHEPVPEEFANLLKQLEEKERG
jgi:hypothetical protein